MLLAQEFLLLYIDNESGKFVGTMTGHGGSVALLADLIREGRVRIDDGEVRLTGDGPTGEWLLDEGVRLIESACSRELTKVIRHLAKNWTPLRKRMVQEFTDRRVLRESERRILFIFPKACWPTENPSTEEATRSRLRKILLANRDPSQEDLALITGVRSCHLLHQFIPRENMKEAKTRMRALTDGFPLYKALKKIKDEDATQVAMITAATTPVFIATS